MVNYRRSQEKGGTYFFTVNLKNRKEIYLTQYIEHLRKSFRLVQQQYPFKIIASVVLPEHLHMVWTLPEGDADFSTRWKMIKNKFTRCLVTEGAEIYKNRQGEYNCWQRRFWEHQIRDDSDLARHVDYIHFNPVKHGYVSRVSDWPYSSFYQYVKQGVLDINWAGDVCRDSGEFGE